MTLEVDRPTTVITGGAGFVGRHIVAALGRAGHRTVVVDRTFDADLGLVWKDHPPLRMVESDVRDLEGSLEGPAQYIVHAAATTGTPQETGSDAEGQVMEAVEATGEVLRWARRRGVVRTVLVSSGAVFGGSRGVLSDEDSRPSPESVYGSAKLAVELFGDMMRRLDGLDVVAVRLGNVYGPGERARSTRPRTSLVNRLLREALDSQAIHVSGQGKAADWTFAEDIGNAIAAVLSSRRLAYGLYHLTSGEMLSPLELAEGIAVALREAGLGTAVVTDRAGRAEVRGALAGARANLELGLGPWTPFRSGIRETVGYALRGTTKEQI